MPDPQAAPGFVCAECESTFEVLRCDSATWAAAQAQFGPLLRSGACILICSDCYEVIMSRMRTVH